MKIVLTMLAVAIVLGPLPAAPAEDDRVTVDLANP